VGEYMKLDERKKKILESIIRDYVETAEPVGSRAVVKKHGLKISAATVRNEMSDLEEMGFLEQPHTSAGRIPSEKGFRHYVDCMMEKETLQGVELMTLQKILQENISEINDLIARIGQFISCITNYASFILIPSVKFNNFKYLQVIQLEKSKALVLLVADFGIIMHRKIDIPETVGPEELLMIGHVFNQAMQGKKIGDISRSDLEYIRDGLKARRTVINNALEAIDIMLNNMAEDRVIISGALNMLNEPEFKDLDKLKRILTVLDEDEVIKNIISDEEIENGLVIKIGKENRIEDFKDMSLVISGYKSLGEMGKIGIIGPVRMEYWKAAGTVETVSVMIEDLLKKYY
jgi:heat-inducible transcriptional repressor